MADIPIVAHFAKNILKKERTNGYTRSIVKREGCILLVYIPCASMEQAQTIGRHLLNKRLCACINVLPEMHSTYFWPPKSQTFEEAHEAVLIAKTSQDLYSQLEEEVLKMHTYKCPCVMAIPVEHINKQYYDWLKGELSQEFK